MSLVKKVRAVEKVYYRLEQEITQFQQKADFRCIENCYSCCTKRDIAGSPLEFLPLAYHLYKSQLAYSFLEKLELNTNQSTCILFNPFNSNGACTHYNDRGLICRLFGFSAMVDKSEQKKLITCKNLKIQKAIAYKNAQELINKEHSIPTTNNYYMKLYAIDLKLSSQYYPLNKAIKIALETILFYFSFKDKQAG